MHHCPRHDNSENSLGVGFCSSRWNDKAWTLDCPRRTNSATLVFMFALRKSACWPTLNHHWCWWNIWFGDSIIMMDSLLMNDYANGVGHRAERPRHQESWTGWSVSDVFFFLNWSVLLHNCFVFSFDVEHRNLFYYQRVWARYLT